jgi:lysophospholipase L1-like esterase
LMKPGDWGAYHNFYRLRDWPSKYLTNCDGAHPTLHGYKVIANELAKFINNQM